MEIKELEQERTYKYLGVEESDRIENKIMKERIKKEYISRVKKILKTELKPKNKIEAIKVLAMPVMRYSFGIIDWYQHEINTLDTTTRKLLHAHKIIYKNQCTARIYIPRDEGGMGMPHIDRTHKNEIVGLAEYIEGKGTKFIGWLKEHEDCKAGTTSITKKANDYLHEFNIDIRTQNGWNEKNLKERTKILKESYKAARKKADTIEWEKHRHAQHFKKEVLNKAFINKEKSIETIARGFLKINDERTLITAQDWCLRTNWFKKHIEGVDGSDKCKMCGKFSETVPHILSGCETLLRMGLYTERHNTKCKLIHYRLCK